MAIDKPSFGPSMSAFLKNIAAGIDRVLNPGSEKTGIRTTGFILSTFNFGEDLSDPNGQGVNYVSNADADEVVLAFRQVMVNGGDGPDQFHTDLVAALDKKNKSMRETLEKIRDMEPRRAAHMIALAEEEIGPKPAYQHHRTYHPKTGWSEDNGETQRGEE